MGMFGNFFTKRLAISMAAFAVVAVAGIATVSIIPAIAAGVSGANARTLAATPVPGTPKTGKSGLRVVAARRIALALYRESVKETGLSRTTVLKDLLNGETLAQIDGSKAQAVESAVMARVTTRLNKAVAAGKITQTQATALSSAATAGISKLMDLNLSTYIRVRFGGLAKTPSVTTPPTSTTSPAAVTGSSSAL
jgi:hypothetical protein